MQAMYEVSGRHQPHRPDCTGKYSTLCCRPHISHQSSICIEPRAAALYLSYLPQYNFHSVLRLFYCRWRCIVWTLRSLTRRSPGWLPVWHWTTFFREGGRGGESFRRKQEQKTELLWDCYAFLCMIARHKYVQCTFVIYVLCVMLRHYCICQKQYIPTFL